MRFGSIRCLCILPYQIRERLLSNKNELNGAVVESVYTADLKSAAMLACGFESRPRYQI